MNSSAHMRIKDALAWAQDQLSRVRDQLINAALDSEVLLAFVLRRDRAYLFAHPEQNLSTAQLRRYQGLIKKRQQDTPVAYLTQQKEFFGLDFFVNHNVLIPRPDTEVLVEQSLAAAQQCLKRKGRSKNRSLLRILEIGTGSGCIAIALKKHLPQAEVTATDVSDAALRVARKNARAHHTAINFLHADLFAHPRLKKYDLIVSNPPYLKAAETRKKNLRSEPRVALTPTGLTPRAIYTKILQNTPQHLNLPGYLLLEIGDHYQPMLEQLAAKLLPSAKCKFYQDYAQMSRVAALELTAFLK